VDNAIFLELESESIEIIREVAATAARPVMLYSIGKDSSVMLRLAQKAFYAYRYRMEVPRDDRV
jgi:3'-phosphoadenosine 5'-phosphosulfate sulfotransferase (PAPS reductase)/FAD synthetase